MTRVPGPPNAFAVPFQEGAAAKFAESGPNGWVLPAGTYYIGFGGDASIVQGAQLTWDATLIAVATVETSYNPAAPINEVNTRSWTPQNPSTATVGVVGGTAVALTVTIPGGTAGSCTFDVGNSGAAQHRIKLVVSTQGNANALAGGKM